MPQLRIGALLGLNSHRQKVLTPSSAWSLELSAFCSQLWSFLRAHLLPGSSAKGREKHKAQTGPYGWSCCCCCYCIWCQVPADFLVLCQRELDVFCSLELKISVSCTAFDWSADAFSPFWSHSNSKYCCRIRSLLSNWILMYWKTLRKSYLMGILACLLYLGMIRKHFPVRYLSCWIWRKRE